VQELRVGGRCVAALIFAARCAGVLRVAVPSAAELTFAGPPVEAHCVVAPIFAAHCAGVLHVAAPFAAEFAFALPRVEVHCVVAPIFVVCFFVEPPVASPCAGLPLAVYCCVPVNFSRASKPAGWTWRPMPAG